MSDLYAVLGVSRDASPEEIKKAYRKLAREYHPDTSAHDNAEDRFKQISAAYETLSDPERRRRYDTFGEDGARAAAGAGGPFGGFGDLGDLMESFFGQGFSTGRRSRGPRTVAQRGNDVETTVRLPLRDAVYGTQRAVELYLGAVCETCSGGGLEPGTSRIGCDACQGTGELRQMQRSIFGAMMTSRPCGRCAGSGQVAQSPCRVCAGEGRVTKASTVTVDIPGGVEHGTTLRVRGRGEAGLRGGEPGDLFVHIGVEPDSVFHRDGDDLVCTITVPATHAMLGATVTVPTLDGDQERLTVEPGTQPGTIMRIRGKGVPRLGNSHRRGDLVVGIDVEIPRKLSGEQRDAVARLADLRGETPAEAPKQKKRGLKDVLRGS